MREYGGFFGLNLAGGKEYYHEGCEYKVLRVNAARYGILESMRDMGVNHIFLPRYLCKSVRETLIRADVECDYYSINEAMLPLVDVVPADAVILITNYFGLLSDDTCERLAAQYDRVIFDFTQSFFAQPILAENVYCVYSPRKFVGVTDGAYVVRQHFQRLHDLPADHSSARVGTLGRALEESTNSAYVDSLASEADISDAGSKAMSKTTQMLLDNIEYGSLPKIRRRNFRILHEQLEKYNALQLVGETIIRPDMLVPMVYPFFSPSKGDVFRKHLVEQHIYVPQWWKYLQEEDGTTEWELSLTEHLFPLPIDQRYTEEDVRILADLVQQAMDE